MIEQGQLKALIRDINPCRRTGKLEAATGATMLARLPGARLGEQVLIGKENRPAEVAGFRDNRVVLLPASSEGKLSAGLEVRATGRAFQVPWSKELLGKVLDAQLRRLDGGPLPAPSCTMPVDMPAPSPLNRRPIQAPLITGVRALDAFTTLGCGQRVGLFSGPGLGKSTLLGQIIRNTRADCCVLCLVGERGREVGDFIRDDLGEAGLSRSVVICATSDAPAGLRARALPVATTVAEGFRRQGLSVLLLVDSLTRHARALREIALSLGESPGRRGFPPSVFDRLAKVIERTGCDQHGSITAVYTVLADGEPEEDPVTQEVQALLDGHIVLGPALAQAGCFPAIDVPASLSRLMDRVVSTTHLESARRIRTVLRTYEERRDMIAAGLYQPGSEPATDLAIELRPAILDFIRQCPEQCSDLDDTLAGLAGLANGIQS
jgi:type III secretion protein N (ATPase)